MLRKVRTVFVLLLVFSFSATLMGNESAKNYFPQQLEVSGYTKTKMETN